MDKSIARNVYIISSQLLLDVSVARMSLGQLRNITN